MQLSLLPWIIKVGIPFDESPTVVLIPPRAADWQIEKMINTVQIALF